MGKAGVVRNAIFQLAQRKFYDEGYTACSMKSIADELGIPSSLVAYHFRQKKHLMEEVYLTFEQNNQELISEVVGVLDNPLLSYFTGRRLLYAESQTDPHIERLRYEMLCTEDLRFARLDEKENLAKSLASYYHLSIAHIDLAVLASASFAATRSVFIDMHEGKLQYTDADTLFSTVEGIVPRSAGVPEMEIQRQLETAKKSTDRIMEIYGDDIASIFCQSS